MHPDQPPAATHGAVGDGPPAGRSPLLG
jgi:hypothetical protein